MLRICNGKCRQLSYPPWWQLLYLSSFSFFSKLRNRHTMHGVTKRTCSLPLNYILLKLKSKLIKIRL
ncbi:hypothetical protein BIW11_11738 [Tropilaelaps mercedesae]|uniref:Uncharacterized protein n=1 Tax=Tropilaelaps mercedesae TaxID=418985 RepID=A0A1V9XA75_9ACAR|nr:hypothetical protein BIW11_11738 [Tropilaelaps mercedesae]